MSQLVFNSSREAKQESRGARARGISPLLPRSLSPSLARATLLALILLAFALRMFHAADALMWGDEGFSVFSASRDLLTITLDTTTIDPHPPLYYYLLHFYFALVGYAELGLRFFSIFFGTATIALVYALAKRTFDARVGLLAALFATMTPFAVQYSQEIRMYALAMFLTTLGLYLFVKTCEVSKTSQVSLWLAYALTMLLALFTLYHTALLFLAMGLVLLTQWRAQRVFVIRWFAVSFAIVALFLPWLAFKYASAFSGIKQVAGETQPMDLFTFVARGFAAISVGTTIPLNHAFVLAGAFAALIALALLLAFATRAAKIYDALLLLLATIPILAYYPLYLAMPLYRGRLFALACLPLTILLARSVTLLARHARVIAILGALFILSVSVYSTSNYFVNYRRYSAVVEDYLPAIREIAAHAQPNDFVLFHAYWHRGYFLSYYHGAPLQYGSLDNQNDLARTVAQPRNVWAIVQNLSHHGAEDWLAQNAFALGEQTYGKMRVLAYRAGTPARGGTFAAPIVFDNGMELLGYHVNDAPLETGRDLLLLQLDWRAAQNIADDYIVSVRVTNARGDIVWARADAPPSNGTQPTWQWQAGARVNDHRVVAIPAGMPPGEYAIQIAVLGARIVAPENRRAQTITLGNIAIERRAAQVHAPIPPNELNARFNEIALVGISRLPEQITRGETLELTLYWRATEPPTRDYRAHIELIDASGAVRAAVTQRPASETFPTRAWTPGETWLDKIALAIPLDTALGDAIVQINLVDESSGRVLDRNAAELGRIKIVAR